MYRNQFLASIMANGQTLREVNGRDVFLPFNTEYSINLRNDNSRRAAVEIKIDGMDALGDNFLIVDAHSDFNIERFLTDGNLHKGSKFKFVTVSDSKVQDPTSRENGLIEIEVWFEKPNPIIWTTSSGNCPPTPWYYSNNSGNMTLDVSYSSTGADALRSRTRSASAPSEIKTLCCAPITVDSAASQAGATVQGGTSRQSFVHGTFGERDFPSTRFRFWLKGTDKMVTTKDTLYCVKCGKKVSFDWNVCPKCGTPIVKQ